MVILMTYVDRNEQNLFVGTTNVEIAVVHLVELYEIVVTVRI